VRENRILGGVSESFFVSGRFCVNRWKFREYLKFPLTLKITDIYVVLQIVSCLHMTFESLFLVLKVLLITKGGI
jgi:hypothetical protein